MRKLPYLLISALPLYFSACQPQKAQDAKYHTPKLPGIGEVDWGKFFSRLTDVGYKGPVCVEVEDRAYEGSLEKRKASLRQSLGYLRQYCR